MAKECIVLLRECYLRSKHAEKNLIDFILKDPALAATLKAYQLAEYTNTSCSTVYRLVRKLGYSGYLPFCAALKGSICPSKSSDLDNTPYFDPTLSAGDVFRFIYDLSSEVCSTCYDHLKPELIKLAAKEISSARQMFFIGLGTSNVTARYAYTKFARLGLPTSFEGDSTLITMKSVMLGKGDVLFAVSSSGRTKSVCLAVQQARQHGCFVIALCDYENSPLLKAADVGLSTTTRDTYKFIDKDFPLIQGQLMLVDMLYACCCGQHPATARSNFMKTLEAAKTEKL